jgi:EAL and modified HD-GYP domain-containing signal transduction protein
LDNNGTVPATGERPVHVGRQALYDRDGELAGYELLFRSGAGAGMASARDASATSQVLINAFAEFGLAGLVGGRVGFVNVTREFLVGELPVPFEAERVVLEVLGSVAIDDEVVAGVTKLVEAGYTIALDDFVFSNATARLLGLASYVKINIAGASPQVLTAVVTRCRFYPNLKLIAEWVETEADLELARRLGFHLFQGYALGRPEVVSGTALTPSRLRTLRLLTLLNDAEVRMDHVVPLVETDPALSYRLLKVANSAAAGTNRTVASVRDAAVLIGLNRLRQWLTLMAVADVSGGADQASSLMVRARFCQRIAERAGVGPEAAFTIGLLDAVCERFNLAPAALVSQLPIAEDLAAGLVEGTGSLGKVLTLARTYETGRPPVAEGGETVTAELTHAYLDTLRWVEDLLDGYAAEA